MKLLCWCTRCSWLFHLNFLAEAVFDIGNTETFCLLALFGDRRFKMLIYLVIYAIYYMASWSSFSTFSNMSIKNEANLQGFWVLSMMDFKQLKYKSMMSPESYSSLIVRFFSSFKHFSSDTETESRLPSSFVSTLLLFVLGFGGVFSVSCDLDCLLL